MRALLFVFALAGATACGSDAPCGVDEEGVDVPMCEVEGSPRGFYCPGEHWGAGDDCNSCGCGPEGVETCTTNGCDG